MVLVGTQTSTAYNWRWHVWEFSLQSLLAHIKDTQNACALTANKISDCSRLSFYFIYFTVLQLCLCGFLVVWISGTRYLLLNSWLSHYFASISVCRSVCRTGCLFVLLFFVNFAFILRSNWTTCSWMLLPFYSFVLSFGRILFVRSFIDFKFVPTTNSPISFFFLQ